MSRLRDAGHEVVSIGKLHFRESTPANGFTEEILPMHILEGKGGVHMLLRAVDREPVNAGQWNLYMDRSGIGTAPYQAFDEKVSEAAIDWLGAHRQSTDKPWVLFVSYPSAHPPFTVPADVYHAGDEAEVELPAGWQADPDDDHPALAYRRRILRSEPMSPADEPALRKVMAGYLALCEHLDRQIGKVLAALDDLGLTNDTRIIYTSDHGEMAGAHGLFGKSCLLEDAIRVPLLMAGPNVPEGRVVDAPVSHVDLYATLLDCVGAEGGTTGDLMGMSLWQEFDAAAPQRRPAFAEYHAAGSKSGSFMLRDGRWKLLYHVGMPRQLFDLEADPGERVDLGPDHPMADALEAKLRRICDPEAVDARAKADQRNWIAHWGGADAVASEALLIYTPPPGEPAEME